MRAIRLHGPSDLRLETLADPAPPGPGEVLLRVKSVGICGSDLHTYTDGRIGDTALAGPLVLGHEFAGVIEAVGPDAIDGIGDPLLIGTRVAVDPARACGQCELCQMGHPNLCLHIRFAGLSPEDGALRDWMLVSSRCCFPIPDSISFEEGALLETLGVAIHAIDLAHIRVGHTVAILGAGPIGLCILQVAKLAGASMVFISDQFDWRLDLAEHLGGIPIHSDGSFAAAIQKQTHGRGVDVAIEAAWADVSIQQSIDIARPGGNVVLVGIPGNDRCEMRHSAARRKGLTLHFARRMKHVYPRAITLHQQRAVDLKSLVTHRFALEQSAEAFAINAKYEQKIIKAMINL